MSEATIPLDLGEWTVAEVIRRRAEQTPNAVFLVGDVPEDALNLR